MRPDSKPPDWSHADAAERLQMCKAALFINGFLTEAENARVQQRLIRWVESYVDGGVKRKKQPRGER